MAGPVTAPGDLAQRPGVEQLVDEQERRREPSSWPPPDGSHRGAPVGQPSDGAQGGAPPDQPLAPSRDPSATWGEDEPYRWPEDPDPERDGPRPDHDTGPFNAPTFDGPPVAPRSTSDPQRTGATRAIGSSMRLDLDGDADGPPPTPFARRRRRRRNALLVVCALIIVGIPLVLGVISSTERSVLDDEVAGDGAPGEEGSGDASPDGGAPDDEPGDDGGTPRPGDDAAGGGEGLAELPSAEDRLDHPDTTALDGDDAVYAQLLIDIDTSELTMIGFQEALAAAFEEADALEQDELLAAVRDAAAVGQDGLEDVREQLTDPLDTASADEIREVYVRHLDAWASYMAAIEDDPSILGSEDGTSSYTLSINVSADAFARTLEEELPGGVDADVHELAEGILERGFRGFGDADV